MIREFLVGRRPSHLQVDPIVKAFIISETILWSSWNAVMPIFAIFVANKIPGGNTEIAASSFSSYLVSRVIFELFSGRYLLKSSEFKKFVISIIGIIIVSLSYLGFAFTNNIFQIYLFYILIGVGVGIASPAKSCLFSCNLDKNKESIEWSVYDAIVFIGMALSATVGGFVATIYGFGFLFIIVSIMTFVSIFPYVLYIKNNKRRRLTFM